MKISLENIERLERNARLVSLYNNTYVQDPRDPNYAYIKEKFFKHEDISKAQTINSWCGLFTTVPNILWNYVGSPYDMNITKQAIDYNILNFAVIVLGMKEDAFGKVYGTILQAPSEGYFVQDWVQYIARFYKKRETLNVRYYVYLQWFYDSYIENKLYLLPTQFLNQSELTQVPLTQLQDTAMLEEIQPHTWWKPPIFLITEEENNIYPSWGELEKIKAQTYAIDRKKIMFDCEFLKNVESFLLIKGIPLPKNVITKYEKGTTIDFADLGKVVQWSEGSSMEFINNTNSLIKDAMESQKDDMRMISSLTSIPLDFLWMDTAHGSLGKGSRGLLHGAFVKKIEYIRKIFDQYLPKVKKALNDMNMPNDKKADLSYSRPDVFSQSDMELLEEVTLAVTNKILTKKKAMMMYLWYTEEEAQKELEEIAKEDKLNLPDLPIITNEDPNIWSGWSV